ncbi:MAG: glycoside hydrolase, partial [Bacteroidetes bacterium]|nr:glycoside hydrolase [Bacteroidota bacterium]
MVQKKRRTTSVSRSDKKPLPPQGWAILIGIVVLVGAGIWWLTYKNENEWTYVKRFGIRLPLRYAV